MNSENIRHKEHVKNIINEEHILVVKRDILLENTSWQGLKEIKISEYLEKIEHNKEFLPRSQMELNPTYKQIIPYLIFQYNNKFFLMQRHSQASEQRLRNKYSLGIGGHIRQEDIQKNQTIIDWSKREFHEEIDYKHSFEVECLGILNDDSNAVGRVHIGFVFLLKGNSDNIKVKSELQGGELLSLEECEPYYEMMESWSQIVFDFLKNK